MEIDFYCRTAGDSIWADMNTPEIIWALPISTHVYCYRIEAFASVLGDAPIETEDGILNVYFDTNTWDVGTNGIFYTDTGWISDFRQQLIKLGFSEENAMSVEYSEQGMQGDDYASLEVDHDFLTEFRRISGEPVEVYRQYDIPQMYVG